MNKTVRKDNQMKRFEGELIFLCFSCGSTVVECVRQNSPAGCRANQSARLTHRSALNGVEICEVGPHCASGQEHNPIFKLGWGLTEEVPV